MVFRCVSMKPKICDGIRIREESWGAILFDRWLGVIYELNEDGYRMLSLCDGEKTVEDIIEALAQEYESTFEQIKPSVKKLLHFLQKHKLVAYKLVAPEKLVKTDFEEIPHKVVRYGGETLEMGSGFEYHREHPLTAPLHVSFEITLKRNLHCQHCYVNAGDSYGTELSTRRIMEFVDELAEMRVFSITICGGEPMTRKDIFPIIERCIQNDIATLLSTNGTLIAREKERKLEKLHIWGR